MARGDPALFERRLAWDGLEVSTVAPVLGQVRLRSGGEVPSWVDSLDRLVRRAESFSMDNGPGAAVDSHHPLPFEEALVPLVAAAGAELRSRCPRLDRLCGGTAVADLERNLLTLLFEVGSRTLQVEFDSYRRQRCSTLDLLVSRHAPRSSRRLYLGFVNRLREGGLVEIFERQPVLARLVATAAADWIDATVELVDRLSTDLLRLQAVFGTGAPLGPVVAMTPGLSDRHNHGRSAIAVTFLSGHQLVYKPRSLGPDAGFYELVSWLDERGAPLSLGSVPVVDASTHGWIEWVGFEPCLDQRQASDFYRRSGMLIALAWVVGAHDLHHENVIARGDQPIPVDLETLLWSPVKGSGIRTRGRDARNLEGGPNDHTVLDTGLLMLPQADGSGRGFDLSALGGAGATRVGVLTPAWRHINTDAMTMTFEPGEIAPATNAPTLDGRTLSPIDHGEEIEEGFREMLAFVIDHRIDLLGPDGPLAKISRHPVRFLFRPTQLYASLLQRMLHPRYLCDGADRSIELEVLSRPLIEEESRPPTWDLVALEREALERMDIPYFRAGGDGVGVSTANGGDVVRCLDQSGEAAVRARTIGLTPDGVERQLALIRLWLESVAAVEPEASES